MPFFKRRDGDRVEVSSQLRRMLPFLLPTRLESFALFRQPIEVTEAKKFLDQLNSNRAADQRVTLFHLFLRALTLVLSEFPHLNRFVAGSSFYQRRGIWLAFTGKQRWEDDAPLFTYKRQCTVEEGLYEMVDDLHRMISQGRSGVETASDKETRALLKIPPVLLRFFLKMGRRLHHWNLLPHAMIEMDPLFSSVFVANIGRVGLDACYHHTFEYGTVPMFIVMGEVHPAPVVTSEGKVEAREIFNINITLDERTEDGFYFAKALKRLKSLLQDNLEELR